MTVHIDQLTSEVLPEPEPGASIAAAPAEWWEELDRVRQAGSRLLRDRQRTGSEGFDD